MRMKTGFFFVPLQAHEVRGLMAANACDRFQRRSLRILSQALQSFSSFAAEVFYVVEADRTHHPLVAIVFVRRDPIATARARDVEVTYRLLSNNRIMRS